MSGSNQTLGSLLATALGSMTTLPTVGGGWDTAPVAAWSPEFDREEIQNGGLQCYVFPMGHEPQQVDRAGRLNPDTLLEVHVAVLLPRSRDGDYAEGGQAVRAAELVIEATLGQQITVAGFRCVECEHDPVISKEYLRENRLWCSYLKTFWRKVS